MAVAVAQLSVPRKSILGYRLLNEASWINLGKVTRDQSMLLVVGPSPALASYASYSASYNASYDD